MSGPEANFGDLEESHQDNDDRKDKTEKITLKEKNPEEYTPPTHDNTTNVEDDANEDGNKIIPITKDKREIREKEKNTKGDKSLVLSGGTQNLTSNTVLMDESKLLDPFKSYAVGETHSKLTDKPLDKEGNTNGNIPSIPLTVELLPTSTVGINKKDTNREEVKINEKSKEVNKLYAESQEKQKEGQKGEMKETTAATLLQKQQQPGGNNSNKDNGVDDEGKKALPKVSGIGPGAVRSLGSGGLKGSSLPLFLSMPGGGGGLSLLSAGLPPGRYVILPSTTSSIPSISSIAPTSAVAGGMKSPVITPIHQVSKPLCTTSPISSAAPSTSPTASAAMTFTTTSTSVVPSIVIPPPSSGRVVRPIGRGGAYCGGRGVRGRRKSYTAAEKLAMIEAVESGQKKSNVADLFGVAPSTLACILLQKNKIRSDQMKVDLSRRRLRQSRQTPLMPAPLSRSSTVPGRESEGGSDPFVHFLSPLSPPTPTVFEDSPEEIISMPDLSDRMGLDSGSASGKLEGGSNYLTCSPLISAMPGMHEDLLHHGAGPSSGSLDPMEAEHLTGDYDHEELMEIKAEPAFNVSSEICEDENSQNNTQSSSDRRSSQSSPTPGMAGPYLLKKETHCTTILDQLLRDDTFSDVTLTAEGQSLRAHKIVLCLASAYFRQVLSKDSTVQNVIVFRDIKFSELRNLINFIYTGEATVDASDLESFMKTAEMLEVNSLSDGQRNLPKNFVPRARDPEPERAPRGSSSSSKRSHNAGPSSPPSKSRRMSADVSPPSKSHKSSYHPSMCSGVAAPSLPVLPPPLIKTEPKSEEMMLEDHFPHGRDEAEEIYDNHTKSPTQHQDPNKSPTPLDRLGEHSVAEKGPPGKCPYCPGSPQVRGAVSLTKHLYLCHPDKTVFSCDICSRAFLKKGAYESHKEDCR